MTARLRGKWIGVAIGVALLQNSCTSYRTPTGSPNEIKSVALATPVFDIQQPSWAGTSASIAFRAMKQAQDVSQQLYVYNAETSELFTYLDLPSGNVYSPSWTDDDLRLAVLTGINGQYAAVNVAGGGFELKDQLPEGTQTLDVGRSSGRTYALYSTDPSLKDLLLAIQQPDGTLSATFPLVQGEKVSADRGVVDSTETKVAFAVKAVKGGTYRTGFIDLHTGNVQWLSDAARDARSPTWSPNGTWLAYLEVDTVSSLVVVSPAKGCSRRVTLPIAFASGLSWSADGALFALSDSADLYVVPARDLLGAAFDASSDDCSPEAP